MWAKGGLGVERLLAAFADGSLVVDEFALVFLRLLPDWVVEAGSGAASVPVSMSSAALRFRGRPGPLFTFGVGSGWVVEGSTAWVGWRTLAGGVVADVG